MLRGGCGCGGLYRPHSRLLRGGGCGLIEKYCGRIWGLCRLHSIGLETRCLGSLIPRPPADRLSAPLAAPESLSASRSSARTSGVRNQQQIRMKRAATLAFQGCARVRVDVEDGERGPVAQPAAPQWVTGDRDPASQWDGGGEEPRMGRRAGARAARASSAAGGRVASAIGASLASRGPRRSLSEASGPSVLRPGASIGRRSRSF